ncbi:MAG TPA: glycosyltransferase family 2 protein [Candidatus Saccharimonadales bacterium]|nr:glycosyltransferase family 2 protein [Candidatus Saccharimonadales bacterium]
MTKPLPVIAAIPNYNMGHSLAILLPQVLRQGYDAVYVLDDASTDNSREIVANFAPDVTWVGGKTNQGAGANRNRVLQAHPAECIIHFLDADVRLETNDVPAKARLAVAEPDTAFVGGLIKEAASGKPWIWNYGPYPMTLYSALSAQFQTLFGRLQAQRPWWRKLVRVLTQRLRGEWPDIAVPPQRRAVYWMTEGNLLVRRSVLEWLGGFDATVREADIIPPARRAYQAGLISYFDPSIAVTHLAIDVRHYGRAMALYKEEYGLMKQYGGWKEWLLPEGHFKPRHNCKNSYKNELDDRGGKPPKSLVAQP